MRNDRRARPNDAEEPLAASPGDAPIVLTRDASRELDRLAREEFGVPSIVLMENAAAGVATHTIGLLRGREDRGVLIVCGPGNNGGDGLAAARHLANAGVPVAIALSTRPGSYTGDAAINLGIVERMRLPIDAPGPAAPAEAFRASARRLGRPGVVVDALLGTGLSRPVEEPVASLIAEIEGWRKGGSAVLAVDVPSGLDADTGEPMGVAVRATTTVTFEALKAGFLSLAAQEYVGEVVVTGIGAPRCLLERLGTRVRAGGRHDEPGHEPRRPAAAGRPRGG